MEHGQTQRKKQGKEDEKRGREMERRRRKEGRQEEKSRVPNLDRRLCGGLAPRLHITTVLRYTDVYQVKEYYNAIKKKKRTAS